MESNINYLKELFRVLEENEKSGHTYSPEYIKQLLNSLERVGDVKLVGYLPIETLIDCGVSPQEMRKKLEAKGLRVLELTEEESKIYSGALYAYNEAALNNILQTNKSILERNYWPTTPEKFVRHLKVFAEDDELETLIRKIFAD